MKNCRWQLEVGDFSHTDFTLAIIIFRLLRPVLHKIADQTMASQEANHLEFFLKLKKKEEKNEKGSECMMTDLFPELRTPLWHFMSMGRK